MSKKYLVLLAITMLFSSCVVMAETTVQQIQSPIYTDDLGRSHFLGKGGYSSVRHIQMEQTQSDLVNSAANDLSKKPAKTSEKNYMGTTEKNITDVINESSNVPVSSKTKATFSAQERPMDSSAPFGNGATCLPESGVNNSKTIYTDELGRLHFFGKGNIVKE